MYDLEVERIAEIIKEKGYSRVCLQFPEGLRDHAAEVASQIEALTGAEVLISANPCYGACDLADAQAAELGAEAVFHFGHAQLLKKTKIPVHYIEVRLPHDPLPLLEEHLASIPRRVGLITTVQHVHLLERARKFLEGRGREVRIGEARGRVRYPGQVLGCSFACARGIAGEVEGFAYLGSGDFHALGVALATAKPVLVFDLLQGEVRSIAEKRERFLRQRFAAIAKARQGKRFGIVVGEKLGQRRLALARRIKHRLKSLGKEAYLIHLTEVTPENLIYFRRLDAFVNTACPRITIEDAPRFPRPMLTPQELEIALDERSWDSYEMDEME
ncbi:diphthamide biosynthesis enzyme Dph2 [Candidatus Pyrohabitans sp.]